jgi:hypothetical protein
MVLDKPMWFICQLGKSVYGGFAKLSACNVQKVQNASLKLCPCQTQQLKVNLTLKKTEGILRKFQKVI